MKIYIFGKKGDGKTTLAREIARELEISVLHLDRLRPWLDREGYLDSLAEWLRHSDWIIEGAWGEKWGARDIAEEADVLIWLDLDPETNYRNRLERIIKKHGGNPKRWEIWEARWREALSSYRYSSAFHREIWEKHRGPKLRSRDQYNWSDIKKFLNDECKSK